MTLLNLSLSGAVFILAAAALRALALRRLPKGTFVALWWVAAARLLLPLELPAPCSIYTLLERLAQKPAPAVPAAGPARPVMVLPAVPAGPLPSVSFPAPAPDPVPAPAPDPIPVGTALWLAVAGLLALWFLASYLRWRLRFREALPVEHAPLASQARLRVSDRIAAPLTYGLLRPVILLPKTMDLTDGDALRCVLAHEEAHIRRLDGLLKLLLAAALCVHWFNPAVWLLYVLANRDMELRCDEAAVRRLGEDQRELYALTLIRMAELRNTSMPLCSSFSENGMEERIKAIMSIKKPSVFAVIAALALVVCVTGAFATTAWEAQAEEAEKKTEPAAPLEQLGDSIGHDGSNYYFTVPSGEGRWNIWITGRLAAEDGTGESVHYLEAESEKGEWAPGQTYTFEAQAGLEELVITASLNGETADFDLSDTLPAAEPVKNELPAGKADVPEGATLIWPVDSEAVTMPQGAQANGTEHSGVDIGGMEKGTPIYAAGKGTVKEAGYNTADGCFVRLDHGNNLETFYSHCQSVQVETGDTVEMGQTIATVGSTGMSTGAHLHYEVLLNGESVDPLWLQYECHYPINSIGVGAACQAEGIQPVCAIQDGIILNAGVKDYGYESERGLFVEILYNSGYSVTFFACDSVTVKTGDSVKAGDIIAYWQGAQLLSYGKASIDELGSAETERQKWLDWAEETLVDGDYPKNSRGETYGMAYYANFLGYEPDLIAAVNDDELEGYIARTDTEYMLDFSPGESAAYENWCRENKISGFIIPLYDSEHNEIGKFYGLGDGTAPRSYRRVPIEQMWEARAQGFPNAKGSEPGPAMPFETIEEAQEAVRNGWRWPEE